MSIFSKSTGWVCFLKMQKTRILICNPIRLVSWVRKIGFSSQLNKWEKSKLYTCSFCVEVDICFKDSLPTASLGGSPGPAGCGWWSKLYSLIFGLLDPAVFSWWWPGKLCWFLGCSLKMLWLVFLPYCHISPHCLHIALFQCTGKCEHFDELLRDCVFLIFCSSESKQVS